MASVYTEASYENALMSLFEEMGYRHVYGPNVERDNTCPLYMEELQSALYAINSGLTQAAVDAAVEKILHIENAALLEQNKVFMDYLQNGVPVHYMETGEERHTLVRLADYGNAERNLFTAVNQWTVVEHSTKRADIVLFLNGMPIVVIELKSPVREETGASEGFAQLRNYMQEVPCLFVYNCLLAISDLAVSKAGTITSGEDRFAMWKSIDGKAKDTGFRTFFCGMFAKERLLDIVQNFICFAEEGTKQRKILAAYHQYFAVKKAIASTLKASADGGDGRGGVFWHTQGSGKSLSMVFYAHLLQKAMNSPTIVVLTDRNDLDGQLFKQFLECSAFLRQKAVQAQSREHLKQLLKEHHEANGILFTTMQKFCEGDALLSSRRNIVVMADEAHRSQYGLAEKWSVPRGKDVSEGHLRVGAARLVRNALPNATYIGFTGTPIETEDRNTRCVFGDYIDIYDMTQSVEDEATRPVYYESRVMKLRLDDDALRLIDMKYDELSQSADEQVIERSKRHLGQMEAILGNGNTIDTLVRDILEHYEGYREKLLTGKAMIVSYNRSIAIKIYNKILELRPAWKNSGKVAAVMTEANNDSEEWKAVVGNKGHRDDLAQKFKDNGSALKIAIVVDMWLTGFDVPSLATMYVYKPMAGYALMQAIARVNRVFDGKAGGLVVDYVGIMGALKAAMKDYTARDKENYEECDVAKRAYPKLKEKLEVCRAIFHGYDYSAFMRGTDIERSDALSGGVDFIAAPSKEKERKDFLKEALILRDALQLCAPIAKENERVEASFFCAVRAAVSRLMNTGAGKKLSLYEINNEINELLKASVKSGGVINLFADAKKDFSIFDHKFLQEIAKMKHKNLAVELLKRLINEQVNVYKRTNAVRAHKFSEMMQSLMNRYLNGLLTNEKVIEELLKMAQDIASAKMAGEELGLTEEEAAFYDALTKSAAVKDFYQNEELIAITKELTESLRKSRTVDWQKRESARSAMKMRIKRLLKKHRYPPEGEEEALDAVMEQCLMRADN